MSKVKKEDEMKIFKVAGIVALRKRESS